FERGEAGGIAMHDERVDGVLDGPYPITILLDDHHVVTFFRELPCQVEAYFTGPEDQDPHPLQRSEAGSERTLMRAGGCRRRCGGRCGASALWNRDVSLQIRFSGSIVQHVVAVVASDRVGGCTRRDR